MNPINFSDDVEVVSGGIKFNYLKNNPPALPTGPDLPDNIEPKKKRSYNKKTPAGSTEIVKAEGEVVQSSTLDTYQDNMNMIRATIGQIDALACDIKQDFDALRASKVVRGKYQYTSMLSKNLSELLSTKISAIKELNTTIKNSNDLDYRREKDRADANAGNDDQAIMNLYNAFISSPVSQGMSGRSILGPNTLDMTVAGSTGIVSTQDGSGNTVDDIGYQNYLNRLTPEQNLMRYENNPNVKEVVVYDAATGARHFDVMDMSTGQSIPNVPRKDDMFLQDTTIDPRKKVARNINLNETYPVVVLNEGNSLNEY